MIWGTFTKLTEQKGQENRIITEHSRTYASAASVSSLTSKIGLYRASGEIFQVLSAHLCGFPPPRPYERKIYPERREQLHFYSCRTCYEQPSQTSVRERFCLGKNTYHEYHRCIHLYLEEVGANLDRPQRFLGCIGGGPACQHGLCCLAPRSQCNTGGRGRLGTGSRNCHLAQHGGTWHHHFGLGCGLAPG